MPFCTQCGHRNSDESRFCSSCGATLRAAGDSISTTTLQSAEAIAEPEPGEALSGSDLDFVRDLPSDAAVLVVRRGPNAGSRFLLDEETTTAGRHPDSDIFLDDVTVSRRHAEFYRRVKDEDPPVFMVRDVGSLNGTYVNRKRIDEQALKHGDEVQVGKYRLAFFPSPRGKGTAS
jgi:pSer/pThr/pTyr-binding forkhead associated (FHA) protein